MYFAACTLVLKQPDAGCVGEVWPQKGYFQQQARMKQFSLFHAGTASLKEPENV
jgi:hypothetical protein